MFFFLFQSSLTTKSFCLSFGVTFDIAVVEEDTDEDDDDVEVDCGDPNGIPIPRLLRLLGLDKLLLELSDVFDGSLMIALSDSWRMFQYSSP
jgi:hypothetical protein